MPGFQNSETQIFISIPADKITVYNPFSPRDNPRTSEKYKTYSSGPISRSILKHTKQSVFIFVYVCVGGGRSKPLKLNC